MAIAGVNFDLMDQLVFYGSYHRKKGNQLIHFIFVPVIMWSAGVWLAYLGPVSKKLDLPAQLDFLPLVIANAFVFNWVALILCLYALYYTRLEPVAGLSWFVILGIPMLGFSNAFQQHVYCAWAWAIGAHLLSWFMQIEVGHNLIEHRKPAVLDSLFQSLVLAALFAWMEGLFALGYRPNLQKELNRRIQTNDGSGREALIATGEKRDDGPDKLGSTHTHTETAVSSG